MQLRRLRTVLTLAAITLLVLAPSALATNGGGQGWFGETTDKDITNVMFATILFFPAVICLFSFVQWRLDRRRHAKEDAAKRRAASADWRGGW